MLTSPPLEPTTLRVSRRETSPSRVQRDRHFEHSLQVGVDKEPALLRLRGQDASRKHEESMSAQPATPPHDRKLGLTGTALTKARNPKGAVAALSAVRDELEAGLIASSFFSGAPFSWVTIAIRFGLRTEQEPHFQPINKKYGDLPLAIEISTEAMQDAGMEDLKSLFRSAALVALVAAAARYGRPDEELRRLLAFHR